MTLVLRPAAISRRASLTALLAILMAGCAPRARTAAPPRTLGTAATSDFDARTAAYVDLHRRVAATVPARRSTDDPKRIMVRRKALAEAIRDARPDARQGAIFTPPIEADFRRVVRADLRSRAPDDRAGVKREVPHVPFAVNDPYPERSPQATVPAMLLASLPRLPRELEYRFCDRHLILLDVDANLIVDYIADVLPAGSP